VGSEEGCGLGLAEGRVEGRGVGEWVGCAVGACVGGGGKREEAFEVAKNETPPAFELTPSEEMNTCTPKGDEAIGEPNLAAEEEEEDDEEAAGNTSR